MNWINKVARAATAFPFSKFDSCSKIDKTPLITRLGRWAPPPPASTPTKPIFPKWLKSFLFGGFASCQPPEDPHGYYAKVLTEKEVRDMFPTYDVDLALSNDQWMEDVFKNLHMDVLQQPFLKFAKDEETRTGLKFLPIETRILITSGSVEDVAKDIENEEDKDRFITFSGLEEDVVTSGDLSSMMGKAKLHHVFVEKLQVLKLKSAPKKSKTVIKKAEWTAKKYRVLVGVYNNRYRQKLDRNLTEGYEYQLIDDVVVLNELDGNRKPKAMVGWWWHPLCNDIETNGPYNPVLNTPASFKGKDMIEFILLTPLARLTWGVYKFPISNGLNSGYGSEADHVRWQDLPHPRQEDMANEKQPQVNQHFKTSVCHGDPPSFMKKHHRFLPDTFFSADGRNFVTINSVDRLFSLNNAELEMFKKDMDTSVLITNQARWNVGSMILADPQDVNLSGDSLTQWFPRGCKEVYSTWDALDDGFTVVVNQDQDVSIAYENYKRNGEPWKHDHSRLQEKLQAEKKLGGVITEDNPGQSFNIKRSFLLRNWHAQIWLDAFRNTPRHLEGLYPRRVHSKPITQDRGKDGYRHEGANGLLGGKVALEKEIIPIFARTNQFHRCTNPNICQKCPPKKPEDGLRNFFLSI